MQEEICLLSTKYLLMAQTYRLTLINTCLYGRKRFKKRLATLPSKLIPLKQDVITELGIDVSPTNDELLCHILAKEIEVHQINFVFGKGKYKTALQRLNERAEVLVDKRKE